VIPAVLLLHSCPRAVEVPSKEVQKHSVRNLNIIRRILFSHNYIVIRTLTDCGHGMALPCFYPRHPIQRWPAGAWRAQQCASRSTRRARILSWCSSTHLISSPRCLDRFFETQSCARSAQSGDEIQSGEGIMEKVSSIRHPSARSLLAPTQRPVARVYSVPPGITPRLFVICISSHGNAWVRHRGKRPRSQKG